MFGEAPERFVDDFSKEFEEAFLEHMAFKHRNSRVAASLACGG